MKTAIQELQEWMSENHFKVTFAFLDQLEYCKEKEKQQIEKASEDGADHGMDVIEDGLDYVVAIEYYNQNYNQNK
jgi:hypothetical protein